MIDATLTTFEKDVIEASHEAPVLVDFWAPWCGPCRSLGPILEKLEREYAGRWKLVKVNSDDNPQLSAQFNVRSIPFVLAFSNGQPAERFVGAQPEGAVRAFLDQLVPDPGEVEHRKAREALAKGQVALADEHLKNALALDPSNEGARLDAIGIALERGDVAGARERFDALSGRAEQESNYAGVRARLEALEHAARLPSIDELLRRIAADGNDLRSRLDVAELHIARREFAPALEQLLEVVKRDRKFGDDIGRLKMLAVFDLAIAEPDLVSEYRRKLSSALY
jgi:putative thioredoxin